MSRRSKKPPVKWLGIALVVVSSVAIAWKLFHSEPDQIPGNAVPSAAPQQQTSAKQGPPSPSTTTFDSFRLKPFAPAKESSTHAWTAEDGLDGEAILKIAHNEFEAERLLAENDRIKRRQLIYRKEPAWVLVERAKASGKPLAYLTLPGLDGQELEVEITGSDLSTSGLSGTFSGHLKDRPTSMVTLAFKQGREAFTILSPDDGTYLQGDPREPGEIIVASFDPDTYQPLPGGEPILSSEPIKPTE